MKKTILTLCIFTLVLTDTFGQTGNVRGNIRHGIDNSPSYAITISLSNILLGEFGTFSDTLGNFDIKNVPVGKYKLKFSVIGNQDYIIQDFEIFKDSTLNFNTNFPCPNGDKVSEKICPHGHKDNIIPIVYGYPTERTMKKAKKGKIWLGGCVITDCDPKWYCKIHKIEF